MLATFCRKYSRSGCLAKPESWPPRFRRTSTSFSTCASCSRWKNSSAVFPAKPIVQRRISIKSKVLDGFWRCAERKLLGLTAKCILESHVAFGNKKRAAVKGGQVVQFEEAILGFALRFQFAAAADVHRGDAAIEKRRANHQETVALQRIFLGAHQSDV